MMKLTNEEQRMLNGEMGAFKQKALEKIIDYANVLGADELCEVKKSTVYFGAHPYLDVLGTEDYDEIFSTMMLCSDTVYELEDFSHDCFSQTCAAGCDFYKYKSLNMDENLFNRNRSYLSDTSKKGVSVAGSCTPYLTGWIPLSGEHFTTTESSNVIMANSIFGAYGNADGLEASAWSAICGRTPKWGLHVKENRYANCIFEIDCPSETEKDWDIIGYVMGKKLPPQGQPVISRGFKQPDIVKLKQCFASLATTSGCEICHIVGITPEAPDLETALGNNTNCEVYKITEEDYNEAIEFLSNKEGGSLELVSLGCPHYSLEEIRDTVEILNGRKIDKNVSVWLWTDISTQAMSDASGYTEILQDAGIEIFNSSCPMVMGRGCLDGIKSIAFDGAKQAHYLQSEIDAKVFYGSRKECLEAAINGRWGE
ncbi:MAG: DUF521 domain-containing protein [Tissierellia bacterium]|nr:DUF521 domain-containing protein [Tissierellia bacterium]